MYKQAEELPAYKQQFSPEHFRTTKINQVVFQAFHCSLPKAEDNWRSKAVLLLTHLSLINVVRQEKSYETVTEVTDLILNRMQERWLAKTMLEGSNF